VSVADEIARDIRFGWSWIRDNKGPQISGIQAEKIRDVNFDQSWISASIDSQPIAVALALPSAIISNSNIDVAYSNIYPGKSHPLGTQTVLKNNRITYFKGNRYRGLYPPESTHSFIFNSEMPLGIVGPPFIPKRESFKTRLIHVLSTGQSLSIGVQPPNTSPRPGISTVQPYSNLMVDLTGRVVPLVEGIQTFRDPTTPNTESPSSALGNYLTALNPSLQNAVTMHGYGAMDYFHLAKGALTVELPDHTRYFAFEDGITRAKLIHAKALELGKRYVPAAVTVIHGEADSRLNTSIESYAKFLGTWQSDYQSELNKIAQDDPNDLIPDEKVPLFTDQMSSYTAQGFTSPRISLAQWEAARVNPDKIFLVGPKYQYHYTDGLHLNVEGYRLLGEYFGKVIDRVIGLKQDWKPLSPLSATRKGAEIRVRFFVPVPPLVFDTALVKAKRESNLLTYGFEYWNSSSNPEKITKVRITGPDEVAITLASNPGTSAGEVIRYAYTGIPGTRSADHYSGAQQENAPRGNLRDSDAAISPAPGSSRKPLYNWAIHFEQPVTCEEQ
jgi:hypothetical protein